MNEQYLDQILSNPDVQAVGELLAKWHTEISEYDTRAKEAWKEHESCKKRASRMRQEVETVKNLLVMLVPPQLSAVESEQNEKAA